MAFLERATEPGVIFGSKAVGEPPLMLAISVREAIRDAIARVRRQAVWSTLDSPRLRSASSGQWNGHAVRSRRRGTTGVMILRAAIFHTPRNPFECADALVALPDGGLAIADGRVAACGRLSRSSASSIPDAPVRDLRGGYMLPGLHRHAHSFSAGADSRRAGIFAARLAGAADAAGRGAPGRCRVCGDDRREFVRASGRARHHDGAGLRLAFRGCDGGPVRTRRNAPGCASSADWCWRTACCAPNCIRRRRPPIADSQALIERFHGHGAAGYAVTPRFALSASEPMLEVCQTLLREHPVCVSLRTSMRIAREIEEVARLFPWAEDYLAVYERFDLMGRRSVFAHNVHATRERIEAAGGVRGFDRALPVQQRRAGQRHLSHAAASRRAACGLRWAPMWAAARASA